MYLRCHHVKPGWTVRRTVTVMAGECVCVTGSLSEVLLWMVGMRDIHTKGQSGQTGSKAVWRDHCSLSKHQERYCSLLSLWAPLAFLNAWWCARVDRHPRASFKSRKWELLLTCSSRPNATTQESTSNIHPYLILYHDLKINIKGNKFHTCRDQHK